MTDQAVSAPIAPSESLWQRRRRLVSREIERIAIAEFAARGYENVTIEQIATAAGTTVRTFYRYFTGKEDLLWAVPKRVSARLGDAILARPADENILDSCRYAIAAGLDANAEDEQMALQMRAILQASAAAPLTPRTVPGADTMVAAIARRMGVDPIYDPRAQVIGGAINAAITVGLQRWFASDGGEDRKQLLIEALDVLELIGAVKGGLGGP